VQLILLPPCPKLALTRASIFGIVTVLGTFEADNRVEHNRVGRLNAMSKERSNKVMDSLNLILDEYLIMSSEAPCCVRLSYRVWNARGLYTNIFELQ
jgi:hypothetical protein